MNVSWKNNLDDVNKMYNSVKFLKEQLELFVNDNYDINYKKIADIINISANIELINEIISQIKQFDKNSNVLSKAANDLNHARDILDKKTIAFKDHHTNNGECSLCGYDWGNSETLKTQIEKTRNYFKDFRDDNTNRREEKIKELKDIFNIQFMPKIKNFLNLHKDIDNEIFKYIFESNNQIVDDFQLLLSQFQYFSIDIEQFITKQDISVIDEQLMEEKLSCYLIPLSKEYKEVSHKHNFDMIFKHYFESNPDNVRSITEEMITNKIKYIEQNYYNTTFEKIDKLTNQLKESERKELLLKNDIIVKISEYKELLKINIANYQNKIIKNIEIPFYIYSGRIMQNYQGGLGILIKEQEAKDGENDTGLNSIRFISPIRPDHDIIYTLSSGQLSTVIIAFTLALNKVYSNDSFNCILIDDPVQTMDELNIASLVELMRNEFTDRQIILSTHEDSFSRYIRYKYSKYDLKAESITLKDLI